MNLENLLFGKYLFGKKNNQYMLFTKKCDAPLLILKWGLVKHSV